MKTLHSEYKTPIAFFAYKRPEHTRMALESLAGCQGAEKSKLIVFCDGPKDWRDEEDVKAVRALVKQRRWCGKVSVIERDQNYGLAKSIITGVTEVLNQYGQIIVLEDDLVLSPQFLNYMNDALEIYEAVPRVMHIAAYMFPINYEFPETFFYRAASCWGWATWKRAWELFEPDAHKLLDKIEKEDSRYEFDIRGAINFYDMLKSQSEDELDSWAIRWYASVFLNNGLCLHPGKSLVNNIGHDGTGVHCGETDLYKVTVNSAAVNNFTQKITEDDKIVELMTNFFRSH